MTCLNSLSVFSEVPLLEVIKYPLEKLLEDFIAPEDPFRPAIGEETNDMA